MAMPRLPQLPQLPKIAFRGNGGSPKKSHASCGLTATTATDSKNPNVWQWWQCHNCHALKLVPTNVSERVCTILVRSAWGGVDAALQHAGDLAKLVSANWGAWKACGSSVC